jgi:hypothetical protein
MKQSDKELELQDERTAEKRYGEQLRKDAHAQPMPYSFTGTKVPEPPKVPDGHLVGRVALMMPDEDVTGSRNDFYIAEKHARVDGVEVFSWTAPIACSFFRRNHQHTSKNLLGPLCRDVAVIRSFSHTNGHLDGFVDDRLRDDAPLQPFPKKGLSIPAPPGSQPKVPSPVPATGDQPTDPANEVVIDPTSLPQTAGASELSQGIDEGSGIRAEELLREQLSAPRGKGLRSVLSTLQPDQYDLVTLPANESTVIEGQPGTGKTIVASHRAAYLVNEQTPRDRRATGSVLVVGPTASYSRHIRDIVVRLGDGEGNIIVLSMPELMQEILQLDNEPTGPASNVWFDADSMLGRLSRLAIDLSRRTTGRAPTRVEVYEFLRQNNAGGRPLTQKTDWSAYLRSLPSYKKALGLRAQRPLLAFIEWELARPVDLGQVSHVIVDEAQDMTALEWCLLHSINRDYSSNKAQGWTILGDLNQRRSDHTLSSWGDVFDELDLDPDTPIRELARAYRSTKPILDFANKLLPRKQRASKAFQYEGPDPRLMKVKEKEIGSVVGSEAKRLIEQYPLGTVAVITIEPEPITKSLRKAGWTAKSLDMRLWQLDGTEVSVLQPGSARGLEFDAVVVVEPADFPTNYGRKGPLYTSLTRANRELAVVHSKPLPRELKRS